MNPIKALFASLKQDTRGSIVTEFGLSIPVFLILLAGIVELGNFLLLNLKVQHTAVAVADLVTRDDEIKATTLNDIFLAVPRIMTPFDTSANTLTVVTSINRPINDTAKTAWQSKSGGLLSAQSSFPTVGDVTTLPTVLALKENETLIVTEVFYSYEPLVFSMIPAQQLRRVAYFRPRLGTLDELL